MPRHRSISPIPNAPHTSRQIGRQAWSDEEEQIWREAVVAVLRAHLLATVRADGRLAHRNGSLGAHLNAYIRKL
ncbi:uncharacterized protein CcaverHIS019_0502250 [Cutaneotrichosporon cavernicola]|uniref:Uncharacterized protein n=1 Tax=Cutaneotrichosporon cavernicola TaxID=279322 RepID=A0AA48QWV7_9TREE|nr:uncharacterized protein CcaverHIS019_0502250 [Cutaneotrichosporon cavernicola]BEI92597.1 hypothetical protein CcaverHIS019_0502250 [Cutaneotrichosporon cavernicola]